MAIFLEVEGALGHMLSACTTDQINEFIPQKRGFRIHGHSTTISLERAYWSVLEEMARDAKRTLPETIELIHDQCLVANDKNLASCLRVICLKYINIYGARGDAPAATLAAE
ncbi:MAG: ribbon-helix-helix domain-containing protein [Rhodospirillales bacterium]|jgi:predicted DNA-binding ribbon-helix-helix protein|nr:ribbon-helix-helix domain-containing protein [Rhodospirillales bacterium]